ncbi:MAG: histidine--tRNA ligase [bacterium]
MLYQKPKGTRDIYGRELQRHEAVCNTARNFFGKNGYQEIRTPTFENAELFIRSIGEHTDIVEKENYTLESSKKVYMLRPEGTASVLRAIIENKIPLPCRFIYIEPMFRRERPQKGRYREFLQIGIEMIGEGDALYDAEMIEQGKRFLESIGASDFIIEINSIGCPVCRQKYKKILKDYLESKTNMLCPNCMVRLSKNFLRIFDCKEDKCQEIYEGAPKITGNLCADCKQHYETVKDYLHIFGVVFDENQKLVRGLDYYTRTVFEFKHKLLGAQDTILAGGRYDLLMAELGGGDAPALGWAMGVDRMLLGLPKEKPYLKTRKKFFIAAIGKELISEAVRLRDLIQSFDHICIMGNPEDSIKQQLKRSHRSQAEYTILYGEDEARLKMCSIKNMESGKQEQVALESFSDFLRNI